MTRMAIVSSFSESCGNAAFTKVLHDGIEDNYNIEVEVEELNLSLLQSTVNLVRKAGDRHIDEMCARLAKYDAVNIQMEAGLYGTWPKDILDRFCRLIDANPNTSITLHSPRIVGTPSQNRAAIMQALKLQFKSAIRTSAEVYRSNINVRLNRRIVKEAAKRNLPLIVHTQRAKKQIEAIFGYSHVSVHPLRLVPDDFLHDPSVFERIKAELGITRSIVSLGLFGFLTPNKGHLDALAALKHLPEDCRLFIFGRQHPQTIKSDGQRDPYLGRLIDTVKAEKVAQRVYFLGELQDWEFMQVAASVDVALLPYYENGQDGSGIASITMDVCSKVAASTSLAFDELFQLIPYGNVERFDIGNDLEMAVKVRMLLNGADRHKALSKVFNIKSQSAVYTKSVTGASARQVPSAVIADLHDFTRSPPQQARALT